MLKPQSPLKNFTHEEEINIISIPFDWKNNYCIQLSQLGKTINKVLGCSSLLQKAMLPTTARAGVKKQLFSLFNTNGGMLFVGLDQSGNAIKLPLHRLQYLLENHQQIMQSFFATLAENISIKPYIYQGKNIVVYEVNAPKDAPILKLNSNKGKVLCYTNMKYKLAQLRSTH